MEQETNTGNLRNAKPSLARMGAGPSWGSALPADPSAGIPAVIFPT